MPRLEIDCPEELLVRAGQTSDALQRLAQEALLVRLYQLSQLSSGRAAAILQVSRRDFLDLLGRYGVSIFDEQVDLEGEAACGH